MTSRSTRRQSVRSLCMAALIAMLFCTAAGPACAAELRIAAVERNAVGWVASHLLACIYKEAGLSMRVQAVPGNRAHLMALEGTVDGELVRMRDYTDSAANLVRVDPPLYRISIVAFSMAARHVRIQSPSDLRHYTVGALRGMTSAQTLTRKLDAVTLTSSPDQMFHMLQLGRIDAALEARLSGAYAAQRVHAQDLVSSPELAHVELHHYLNVRHKDSAARLNATLERLQKSGALQRMTAYFEQQVFQVDLDHWTETEMPEASCVRLGQP